MPGLAARDQRRLAAADEGRRSRAQEALLLALLALAPGQEPGAGRDREESVPDVAGEEDLVLGLRCPGPLTTVYDIFFGACVDSRFLI